MKTLHSLCILRILEVITTCFICKENHIEYILYCGSLSVPFGLDLFLPSCLYIYIKSSYGGGDTAVVGVVDAGKAGCLSGASIAAIIASTSCFGTFGICVWTCKFNIAYNVIYTFQRKYFKLICPYIIEVKLMNFALRNLWNFFTEIVFSNMFHFSM